MFTSHHKVVHHAKKVVAHVKKHHRTYLLFGGLAGSIFLAAKVIMFFATSYVLYNASHDESFADFLTNQIISEQGTGSVSGDIQELPVEPTSLSGSVLELSGTVQELSGDVQNVSGDVQESTGTVQELPVVIQSSGTDIPQSTGTQELTGTATSSSENLSGTEEYGFQTNSNCNYSGFSSNLIPNSIYTGIMNLNWTIAPNCSDEIVEVQLYDHNEEWITLAKVSGTTTGYLFDTTLLGSGFYAKNSGDSALYSGVASSFWTGYRMRWLVQPDTILSETTDFTIDNTLPQISSIALSSSGVTSGVVGINAALSLQFTASEALSGVRVFIGTGEAIFSQLTGNRYSYRYTLPASFASGAISYRISYQDLAGHTGMNTATSQLIFDPVYPQILGYGLSGYSFSFTTSELTRANSFVLLKNTTQGWAFYMTGLSTGHSFSLPTLLSGTEYDMGIVIQDVAGNEGKAALSLKRNASGTIVYSVVATLYGQTLTTYASGVNFLTASGNFLTGVVSTGLVQSSIMEQFKTEINRFSVCKNNITYGTIKLQIKGMELTLSMPDFKRDETKKLVNAFVLYILKSFEKSKLSQRDLQGVTESFNDFLVILKLVKDDGNSCKQTLSNYHLDQFKQSLSTYGVVL